MDRMNRGGIPSRGGSNPLTSNISSALSDGAGSGAGDRPPKYTKLVRVGFLTLLFGGTILAIAALLFLAFGKGVYKERQFVDKDKLQAVFINVNGTNGGQVYFGNITEMTSQYIRLANVYYIQNQQAQNSQASAYNLVKLGCELHGPEDAMFINRDEVFFWENLKTDSQVAQKVAEFRKQNPNGQKCNSDSNPSQQPTGTTQQPGSGNNGGTTNTQPSQPSGNNSNTQGQNKQ